MNRTPSLPGLLEFAIDLSRRAGAVTLEYFQSARLRVDYKPDATPVTDADRSAEQLIRERIAEAFPDHAIMGEEFGERPGHIGPDRRPPRFRWIIDPIDGTKSFIHGVPLYGVMIALEVEDRPSLGVVHFPALNETVAAARGHGCLFNDARCRVSETGSLSDATLLSSAVTNFERIGRQAGFDRLLAATKYFRTWGDCYGYALVATGRADIMIDPLLEVWDAAPMVPILTEAGGVFTDLAGEPTIHGRSGIAANARLHAQALAMLNNA